MPLGPSAGPICIRFRPAHLPAALRTPSLLDWVRNILTGRSKFIQDKTETPTRNWPAPVSAGNLCVRFQRQTLYTDHPAATSSPPSTTATPPSGQLTGIPEHSTPWQPIRPHPASPPATPHKKSGTFSPPSTRSKPSASPSRDRRSPHCEGAMNPTTRKRVTQKSPSQSSIDATQHRPRASHLTTRESRT